MTQLPVNPRYGIRAISWSDVVAIEYNVGTWYRRFTGTLPVRQSASMSFGSHVHAMIEKGLIDVPRGKDPERTLTREVKRKAGGSFTIVGTPDDADEETIYEYKTGLKLWSQSRASAHGQLPTYALLREAHTGILPKRAILVSLETAHDEDAGIYLTGNTRVIEVPITRIQVLKIQARFIAAYDKAIHFIESGR